MIDEWIDPQVWPQAVQDAAAQFEQGAIVEQPPFFYVGSAEYGIWRLTRETGDPSLSSELFELDPLDSPPFGMITTETCDLVEEDGRPRQPWISVAPVYELANLDTNTLSLLANNRVAYMRRLTAERFSESTWVADVRIEFPVEKSWLVGKQPIPAFNTLGIKRISQSFCPAVGIGRFWLDSYTKLYSLQCVDGLSVRSRNSVVTSLLRSQKLESPCQATP